MNNQSYKNTNHTPPSVCIPNESQTNEESETTKYIKVKKKNYWVLGPHEKLNPNIPSQSQWKETSAHGGP